MKRILPLLAALLGACNVSGALEPDAPGTGSEPTYPGTPPTPPATPAAPAPAPTGSALAGARLFVAPNAPAKKQADAWRASRPADAALMDRLAAQPTAQWFAEWSGDVTVAVRGAVSAAAAAGRTPVLVAYNIPGRDCGLYSAGGVGSADAYRKWIRAFAAGLNGSRVPVILEPDAAAGAECLDGARQEERFSLLRDAVDVLTRAGALVYIDAGNARWHSVAEAAAFLARAGVANAHGFALNVSNFVGTGESADYGSAISSRLGGKRYVIDTSRNGLGPAAGDQWCNPAGRAVGDLPSVEVSQPGLDALLWVKVPGESDGTCNGGPGAGQWWGEYALGLAQRAVSLR